MSKQIISPLPSKQLKIVFFFACSIFSKKLLTCKNSYCILFNQEKPNICRKVEQLQFWKIFGMLKRRLSPYPFYQKHSKVKNRCSPHKHWAGGVLYDNLTVIHIREYFNKLSISTTYINKLTRRPNVFGCLFYYEVQA